MNNSKIILDILELVDVEHTSPDVQKNTDQIIDMTVDFIKQFCHISNAEVLSNGTKTIADVAFSTHSTNKFLKCSKKYRNYVKDHGAHRDDAEFRRLCGQLGAASRSWYGYQKQHMRGIARTVMSIESLVPSWFKRLKHHKEIKEGLAILDAKDKVSNEVADKIFKFIQKWESGAAKKSRRKDVRYA